MLTRILTGALAFSLALGPATTAMADSYSLTGGDATTLKGVSPFAVNVSGDQDRVFFGSSSGGWGLSTCTGASCTAPSMLPVTFGADYTQVSLSDGTLRAYFINPGPAGKSIETAAVTYDAQGTPVLGPSASLGISATPDQRAWGVPDSVVLPDGRVRLYWVSVLDGGAPSSNSPTRKQLTCLVKAVGKAHVKALSKGAKPTGKDLKALRKCRISEAVLAGPAKGGTPEVILSATSTDASGTSFVQDPGTRFSGGYVDSDIVQAKDGDWIALLSTGPGAPPQRLYAATSKDGLTWKVDGNALTGSSVNSLDPSAVPAGPNTWRVYWSQSPKATPFSNHTIVTGTLTR